MQYFILKSSTTTKKNLIKSWYHHWKKYQSWWHFLKSKKKKFKVGQIDQLYFKTKNEKFLTFQIQYIKNLFDVKKNLVVVVVVDYLCFSNILFLQRKNSHHFMWHNPLSVFVFVKTACCCCCFFPHSSSSYYCYIKWHDHN